MLYVASKLQNSERAQEVIAKFRKLGVTITYDWTTHNQVFSDADLRRIGELEAQGVKDAKVVFLLLPGGGGAHWEAGMAYALNKPVVVLNHSTAEQKSFYHIDGVHLHSAEDAAIAKTIQLLEELECQPS
jgi:nucleoside 2-deoxyribosyltransferase